MEAYIEEPSEESGSEDIYLPPDVEAPRYMCDGYNVVALAPSNDIFVIRLFSGSFSLELTASLEYVTYGDINAFNRSIQEEIPGQLDLTTTTRIYYQPGIITARISAMGETMGLRSALYHEVSVATCSALKEAFLQLERRRAWFGR